MKKQSVLLSSLLLTFLFAAAVFGQTGAGSGSTGATTFRGLKNKPYSAELIRENVRTLADGNTITETTRELQYRDSEGRTRREEVSRSNPQPYSFTSISILDPVGGYTYSLIPHDKTVFRTKLPPPVQVSSFPTPAGYSRKIEPLGNRIIEGIETTGSRGVSTIAPGTIGNERAIETISEGWSSPELRLTLLSISDDPRFGKSTTRLTNIKRDEPDKSLFEIPPDYKIIDREPFRPMTAVPAPANSSSNEDELP